MYIDGMVKSDVVKIVIDELKPVHHLRSLSHEALLDYAYSMHTEIEGLRDLLQVADGFREMADRPKDSSNH